MPKAKPLSDLPFLAFLCVVGPLSGVLLAQVSPGAIAAGAALVLASVLSLAEVLTRRRTALCEAHLAGRTAAFRIDTHACFSSRSRPS